MSEITHDPDYEDFCYQRLNDPYPLFARLREQDPVHWCEPMHMWLVTRYDDVRAALRDKEKRLSNSRRPMYTDPLLPENRASAAPMIDHICRWLLNVDPPDHTRMRRLVSLVFTPRMLQELKPSIEAIVEGLLDDICAADETDLIHSFCLPLPAAVICEMLGVPDDRRELYCECVKGMLPFSSGGGPAINDHIAEAQVCLGRLIALFDELIAERRTNPQADLITAMTEAEADGDRLSREELFALCVFIFIAGHETTSSLLGSGMLAFLQNPEQFEKFKTDPDGLVDSAVEEFLRYDPPVTRGARVALQDFELRGKQIHEGQMITHLIGAANRDPAVFENPDTIDITRQPNNHIAFGFGMHFCLGAHLARIEGSVAFRAVARRLPNLLLADNDLPFKRALGLRSLEKLRVHVNA
jgi:cytochrome P450